MTVLNLSEFSKYLKYIMTVTLLLVYLKQTDTILKKIRYSHYGKVVPSTM